ncbi:MAG: helix-turn-helix domain-containing protein [Campylobacterales bacterium]|nr:helix-turn-helix domain-containing protein [Campylobacterales bacterium]
MKPTKTTLIAYKNAPFVQIRQTFQSKRVYETHAHTTLSIGFMVEGETSFQTPSGAFLLQQGALAVIPPLMQHACNPLAHQARSYVMVYFEPAFCAQLQSRLFHQPTTTLLPLKNPLIYHQELYEEFITIIDALIRGYEPLHVKALEQWLERFLWLYTQNILPKTPAPTLQAIAHFLTQRLDETPSLQDLAKRFSYNPYVLLRHFKKAYGTTPKRYALQLKIELAKKLLQEGMPASLCAHYCGFVDQSHFQRFFKRHTALTPKEYHVNFVQ